MLFCMVINVTIERIGYKPLRNQPRLAPLITAIGFSFILQGIGLAWKGPGPRARSRTSCRRATLFEFGDVTYYTGRDLIVLLITVPVLLALTYLVQSDEAGQGDARDGPGPRRRRR